MKKDTCKTITNDAIGVPEQRTGKEEILEEIIAKDFPKLIKEIQS